MRGGGTVVAERLGGRRVYPNTTDPVERRLLNVVEEMALASGVPVPPVFLLTEEKGINAFAAGFSPSDAVIGVTRGCAEQLTRDQLQGVIAHEFSHILNGDMRLNLRLIGVLHGILVMGLVGRELLRIAGYGGGGRSRKNNGVAVSAADRPGVHGARLSRPVLRQPHQGGRLAAARVSWPTPRPCSSRATPKASPAR